MGAIISAGLALLSTTAPLLTGSSAVGAAIEFISAVLPPSVQLAKEGIPVIKSVIASLRSNGSTTKEQMDQLDVLDAQCDARLDAAIAKAEAEDAAAEKA